MILEEMAEAEDLAEDLLHEAFLRRLWPAHALGAPILGTKETVARSHARAPRGALPSDRAPRGHARRGRGRLRPGPARGASRPRPRAAFAGRARPAALPPPGEAPRGPLRVSSRAAGPPADAPSRGRADDPVRPSARSRRVDRDRGARGRRLVAPVARRARAARPGLLHRDGSHAASRGGRRSRLGRDAAEEPRAPRRDDGAGAPALPRGRRHARGARPRAEPVPRGGRALARVHGRAARERRPRLALPGPPLLHRAVPRGRGPRDAGRRLRRDRLPLRILRRAAGPARSRHRRAAARRERGPRPSCATSPTTSPRRSRHDGPRRPAVPVACATAWPRRSAISLRPLYASAAPPAPICARPSPSLSSWLRGRVLVVPTGLVLEIPAGFEGQVRARSGLALKKGLALANGVGTIDCGLSRRGGRPRREPRERSP